MVSGPTVYAGGDFDHIGGQDRNHIAAIDATTGAATSWNPDPNGIGTRPAEPLAVSGSTVYVGGGFTSIGGQPRNRIAALDATTGAATSWNPNANLGVSALVVSGSTVYVGGTSARSVARPATTSPLSTRPPARRRAGTRTPTAM